MIGAEGDPIDQPYPIVTCPKCGNEQEDLDGFGVVFCERCRFCTHPSRDGGLCGICGDMETE